MEDLKELFMISLQLKPEIEKLLSHEVYLSETKRGGWGLYATSRKEGNFGYVGIKIRADKWFPNCPLPHLLVAVDKDWADDAGIIPENVNPNGWHEQGHPEGLWCIPKGNHEKLKEVAKYLAKIYLSSPAQRKWLEQNT